jgi:hypothetical protein
MVAYNDVVLVALCRDDDSLACPELKRSVLPNSGSLVFCILIVVLINRDMYASSAKVSGAAVREMIFVNCMNLARPSFFFFLRKADANLGIS